MPTVYYISLVSNGPHLKYVSTGTYLALQAAIHDKRFGTSTDSCFMIVRMFLPAKDWKHLQNYHICSCGTPATHASINPRQWGHTNCPSCPLLFLHTNVGRRLVSQDRHGNRGAARASITRLARAWTPTHHRLHPWRCQRPTIPSPCSAAALATGHHRRLGSNTRYDIEAEGSG